VGAVVLVMAGGAEEMHTSLGNTVGVGPWPSSVGVAITGGAYTGAAGFTFKLPSAGQSPFSSQEAKGWWSWVSRPPEWGDGTFRTMWKLGIDGGGGSEPLIGWIKGSVVTESVLRLWTRTGNYDSSTEFTKAEWHRIKVEFDNGVWQVWASDNGAEWALEISQDDSGTYTTLSNMGMSINSNTDETKVASQWQEADDCHFWDPTGDNWNSRITEMSDFPRISAAHMPNPGSESDAGQAAKIDEIPNDGVDKATIDEDEYWTDCEDLKEAPEDYTAEVIQAVMITHVAGTSAGQPPAMELFNVREGGTLYLDSAEDTGTGAAQGMVQYGTDGGGENSWWTTAGYYPWTPEEDNWTEVNFNACQYGDALADALTDQMTVQVIYFGSSHEWPAPEEEEAVVRRVRGLVV